jgi:hypothetical protein
LAFQFQKIGLNFRVFFSGLYVKIFGNLPECGSGERVTALDSLQLARNPKKVRSRTLNLLKLKILDLGRFAASFYLNSGPAEFRFPFCSFGRSHYRFKMNLPCIALISLGFTFAIPSSRNAAFGAFNSAPNAAVGTLNSAPVEKPASRSTFDIEAQIRAMAEKYRVPAAFVKSIVAAESGFNSGAVSAKGAIGPMQLMPETARALGADPTIPEQNIEAGTRYLSFLINHYRNSRKPLACAIAAYNAGPGAVDRYHGVPPFPETRGYVARVLAFLRRFRREDRRGPSAPMVAEVTGGSRAGN